MGAGNWPYYFVRQKLEREKTHPNTRHLDGPKCLPPILSWKAEYTRMKRHSRSDMCGIRELFQGSKQFQQWANSAITLGP